MKLIVISFNKTIPIAMYFTHGLLWKGLHKGPPKDCNNSASFKVIELWNLTVWLFWRLNDTELFYIIFTQVSERLFKITKKSTGNGGPMGQTDGLG